ncbi:MAG: hypothetical protein JZU52_20600 [Lamprocystis purpurea]|nr:hypothetical protein [Lamprocystis purpurea]
MFGLGVSVGWAERERCPSPSVGVAGWASLSLCPSYALHDFASPHRVTAAWVARHPDDLAARRNLAETLLTSGQTAAARDALAALLGPATATPALPPETMAALRLLELAALTRLAGDGDAAATPALPARRAELRALLDAQPDDFALGWTFDGTPPRCAVGALRRRRPGPRRLARATASHALIQPNEIRRLG